MPVVVLDKRRAQLVTEPARGLSVLEDRSVELPHSLHRCGGTALAVCFEHSIDRGNSKPILTKNITDA